MFSNLTQFKIFMTCFVGLYNKLSVTTITGVAFMCIPDPLVTLVGPMTRNTTFMPKDSIVSTLQENRLSNISRYFYASWKHTLPTLSPDVIRRNVKLDLVNQSNILHFHEFINTTNSASHMHVLSRYKHRRQHCLIIVLR